LVGEAKFTGAATRYDNRSYVARLHSEIARRGLEDAVSFPGEREDIVDVLRALDVVLVPSWEEPFGRVVAEAMAAGTPVVATNAGGPAEIVEHEISGLLAPPADADAWVAAVGRILSDEAFADTLRRNGRRIARERFSREAHVRNVMALYSEALDQP
jgi:glycosyltransferase involved in cell wall biosynthesis